jgi:hypothetical protein
MGLSLEVGILADLRENDEEGYQYFRSQLDIVNKLLQLANAPLHTEPENCDVWSGEMFGYSGLHYLRRVAAHLDSTGRLPEPGKDNASEDPVLEQYLGELIFATITISDLRAHSRVSSVRTAKRVVTWPEQR